MNRFIVNDSTMLKGMIHMKVEYKIISEHVFKGSMLSDTISIITGVGKGDCGVRLSLGHEYIIYAVYENKYFPWSKEVPKFLTTNICTRTKQKNINELRLISKSLLDILLEVKESPQSNKYSINPNPLSELSNIEYSLDVPSVVTIDLFDVLSNRVAQLEKGKKQVGKYSATIDTQSLPVGVYYCKIDIGGVLTLKKFLVIK